MNKNKISAPVGRPTLYSIAISESICEAIATSSNGLAFICKKIGIAPSSVYLWLTLYPEFSEKYAQARDAQAHLLADEIIAIADDASNDFMTIQKGDQTYNIENKEWVNRSRLRVEARKWLASKLAPKKYGEKLDLTTDGQKINEPDLSKYTYDELKQLAAGDKTSSQD